MIEFSFCPGSGRSKLKLSQILAPLWEFGLYSVVFTIKISDQVPLGESAEGDIHSSLFPPTVMYVWLGPPVGRDIEVL